MVLPLAALLLLAPAEGLRLDWQAPAGCPDGAALRARVVDLVGAEATRQATLGARARVRGRAGRWTLELALVREGGEDRRTLGDPDCRALAEAAALVLAVAIDPQARLGGPVPEDSPPADPAVPPDSSLVPLPPGEPGPSGPALPPVPRDTSVDTANVDIPNVDAPPQLDAPARPVPGDSPNTDAPAPPAPPVPGDSAAARPRWLQLGLRLGAGLGFTRLLPGPHAALDLGLGLEGRGWRVELAGLFVPPVRGVAASDPGIGGVFRLGAGELRGCGVPALRARPLAFPLCVGLQFGAMYGRGTSGLPVAQAARSPWVATRLGGALRWRPRDGRVGLWLGLDAIVALTRPAFVTAGGVLVHEGARLGGQASLGLELRLR